MVQVEQLGPEPAGSNLDSPEVGPEKDKWFDEVVKPEDTEVLVPRNEWVASRSEEGRSQLHLKPDTVRFMSSSNSTT